MIERTISDDHPGGMGRGMAIEPLQLQGNGDQLADVLIGVALLAQFRFAGDGLGQGHRIGRIVWNQFADPVDLPIRHL